MSFLSTLRRLRERARGIMGINRRNLEFVFCNNARGRFPLVDDKPTCKEMLARARIPVPRSLYHVRQRRQIRGCIESLRSLEHFVVKPARSYGGQGLLVLRRLETGCWRASGGRTISEEDLEFHMGLIMSGMYSLDRLSDQVLIEKLVEDHLALQRVHASDGVSDVRTIVYRGRVVMAMLRLPCRASGGLSNLHAGGIGAGIDLATGTTTQGVSSGRPLDSHPDTGVSLRGFVVPEWERILAFSESVTDCFGMGYLGVDTVIDRTEGPLVLEVNARPGLDIQLANRRGLLEALAPYVEPDAGA